MAFLGIEIFIIILLAAFVAEFLDTALGLGFGSVLAPVLLLMNYSPLAIIPAILFAEAFTGLLAGYLHHEFENVDFKKGSQDRKIVSMFLGVGILAVLIAVHLSSSLPPVVSSIYLGFLVLSLGLFVALNLKRRFQFSYFKLAIVAVFAAFNKGFTGGGYGPVSMTGQIYSGVNSKRAVGITSLAEGTISLVGVIFYFILPYNAIWDLVIPVFFGSLMAVPLAAYSLKYIKLRKLRMFIAISLILLGTATLIKFFIPLLF